MTCQVALALLALAGMPDEAPGWGDPQCSSVAAADSAGGPRGPWSPPASTWAPCDAADVDPWVTQRRDLTLTHSELVGYAVERYGPPVTCEGSVTTEFDGMKFGLLQLGFAEGVSYRLETMPLETSIVTLRVPSGFDDEDSARQLLETYAAGIGLHIDWTEPMTTTESEERVQSFADPDTGLNAHTSLIYAKGALVALRLSMAL